jgi:hypothetical protein
MTKSLKLRTLSELNVRPPRSARPSRAGWTSGAGADSVCIRSHQTTGCARVANLSASCDGLAQWPPRPYVPARSAIQMKEGP